MSNSLEHPDVVPTDTTLNSENPSKLDDESSWSLRSTGKPRRSRHSKKRFPKASSTPVPNHTSQTSSPNFTQYLSSLNDTWVQDSLFLRALQQFEKLKKSWTNSCNRSTRSFVRLATVILQCTQGKIPDNIPTLEYPASALLLLRQGQLEQGSTLCQGFALEHSFTEVQSNLIQMKDSIKQIVAWRNRLAALHGLLTDQSKSTPDTSVAEQRAQLILWPAVLSEVSGLLSQLDRDIQARTVFLSQAASVCVTASGAHRNSLSWCHLITLVRWDSLTQMLEQLSEILR